jgi:hypothetical protein
MLKKCFFVIVLFLSTQLIAQVENEAVVAYPTNWFVQMKWNKVQVLLRSTSLDLSKATISIAYPGVKLLKVNKFDNKNYVALDLEISTTAKKGNVSFLIKSGNVVVNKSWPIMARREGKGTKFAQGIDQSDFIYFLMPDRFSNGDPSNDRLAGMLDQTLNRDSIYHRHGGDLQGVSNNLDYLQKMGTTALWMTPVIENDMPNRTEHGYAFTDHYTIEKRFGGAAAYLKLSDDLHKRGMKLIQDAVYNHVGRF